MTEKFIKNNFMVVTIGTAMEKIKTHCSLNKKNDFNWVGDSIDNKGLYLNMSNYSSEDLRKKYVVYLFVVNGKVYIGKTNNIVRRLHEHFTRRDGRIYPHLGKENCIYASVCEIFDTKKDAREYEKNMISALQFCPTYKLLNKNI